MVWCGYDAGSVGGSGTCAESVIWGVLDGVAGNDTAPAVMRAAASPSDQQAQSRDAKYLPIPDAMFEQRYRRKVVM